MGPTGRSAVRPARARRARRDRAGGAGAGGDGCVSRAMQDAGRLAWSANGDSLAVEVTRRQDYRIVFADHAAAAPPAIRGLLAQAFAPRATLLADRRLPHGRIEQ